MFGPEAMRSGMLSFLMWSVGAYVLFAGILFGCQRSLLYHPNQALPDPAEYGLKGVSIERIDVNGQHKLFTWWRRPESMDRPVIVYFHGNAGHLGHRAEKIRPYVDAGYGVLLVSYRYNAGAGGSPSEEALYDDGRAAMTYLKHKGVSLERTVIYGESLGVAVAVAMAVENPVGAVVLESPYSSIAAVAQSHYWYLPTKFLVLDKFDVAAKIERIGAPLLIVHGERDRIIPVKFGRALLERAKEPKVGRFLPEAGHNDLYEHGAASVILEFLFERMRVTR
jgi:fermentation-respiration switch protein FrsA (DUF1100 family)